MPFSTTLFLDNFDSKIQHFIWVKLPLWWPVKPLKHYKSMCMDNGLTKLSLKHQLHTTSISVYEFQLEALNSQRKPCPISQLREQFLSLSPPKTWCLARWFLTEQVNLEQHQVEYLYTTLHLTHIININTKVIIHYNPLNMRNFLLQTIFDFHGNQFALIKVSWCL